MSTNDGVDTEWVPWVAGATRRQYWRSVFDDATRTCTAVQIQRQLDNSAATPTIV